MAPLILMLICFCFLMAGFWLGRYSSRSVNIGIFEINHSDPSKDLCNLILEKDLDVIEKNQTINFKVRVIDDSKGV